MSTFTDLPVELQDKIMDMKADLEEQDEIRQKIEWRKERERKLEMLRREWADAMEDFLLSYGYYDQFRDEFMDGLEEGEEKEEWKEWFGIEDEEGA